LKMIYLSGVTTPLATWILAKAQRDISAERASVIYAVDPVYGAAFSYLLVGETLGGVPGWIGARLITWRQLRMPLCIRFQI
jgi:drug/metabolite transporter (DMT)-like permease